VKSFTLNSQKRLKLGILKTLLSSKGFIMKKKKAVELVSFFWLFLILLIGHGSKMYGSYPWAVYPSKFFYHIHMNDVQKVKKCLKAGADVNEQYRRSLYSHSTTTVLHEAAWLGNLAVLKVLLKTKGIKIDARSDDGEIPFMAAAFWNRENCMKLLLAKGAAINAQNDQKDTALHMIAKSTNQLFCDSCLRVGKNAIFFLLKAGADQSIKNNEDKTPFDYATEEIKEIMEPFIKKVDEKNLVDEDPSCSICYEEEPEKSMRILDCEHSFHKVCIEQWFVKSKTCPICRGEVS
jgi:hypothetical protein